VLFPSLSRLCQRSFPFFPPPVVYAGGRDLDRKSCSRFPPRFWLSLCSEGPPFHLLLLPRGSFFCSLRSTGGRRAAVGLSLGTQAFSPHFPRPRLLRLMDALNLSFRPIPRAISFASDRCKEPPSSLRPNPPSLPYLSHGSLSSLSCCVDLSMVLFTVPRAPLW